MRTSKCVFSNLWPRFGQHVAQAHPLPAAPLAFVRRLHERKHHDRVLGCHRRDAGFEEAHDFPHERRIIVADGFLFGEAVGSDRLQGEGVIQEVKGKGQKAVGDVKEATKDAVNTAAAAANKNL